MASSWPWITIILAFGFASAEIQNKGWWNHTVFYQVYPRSFMDTDGDGAGDLKGITDKLEYFVESGIGAIWLCPVYASPMVDFGYDISDFRAIDKTFGTMQDFEALTQKAKKLGIKVVMDFVPNHTSEQHYWFQQSFKGIGKYKDYYMWFKGRENNTKLPNNWLSVFGGPAWTYNATRGLWYYHQFEYRQPDLNLSNPYVLQEFEDILKFWLGKGVDGFRVDAVPFFFERDDLPDEPRSFKPGLTNDQDYFYLEHIYSYDDLRSNDLVKIWRKIVDDWADSRNEDEKIIMTESYSTIENITKLYNYGAQVPFNMLFIKYGINKTTAQDFKKIIDDWMALTPSDAIANWVIGNHDNNRTANRYPGRADQMNMLPMILPGVVVTYYGEEIAMEDKFDISWKDTVDPYACTIGANYFLDVTRDPHRTPFQWDDTKNAGFSSAAKTWLPINENYKELNLAKQKQVAGSHYKIYQALTKLRSTSEALKKGSLQTKVLDGNGQGSLAVLRQTTKGDQGVLLLINFSDDQAQKIKINTNPVDITATVVVSSVGSNIKWGSLVKLSDVELPPKASVVLQFSSLTKIDIVL